MADIAQSARKPAAQRAPAARVTTATTPEVATLNAAPTTRALQATAHLLNAGAPAQRAANHTGLPDNLKAGVEALSGIAMDDVRVHRNSSRPAQLEAHAYAQGTDIHLAPGQDRHLPHEAWHVVQQKQGRVRPTAEIAGAAINDDRSLEHEADIQGARALQSPAQRLSIRPVVAPENRVISRVALPVQRKELIYQNGSTLKPKTLLPLVEGLSSALDESVQFAATFVQASPMLDGIDVKSGMGYLSAWTEAFTTMIATKAIPEFFYARYGYAIETIAAAHMLKTSGPLTVTTQYAKGATRPDFVVWYKGRDIAWLDITSQASAGHILKKQHSGWKTRPFVAEILYKTPKVTDFKNKKLNEKQMQALDQINADSEQAEEDYATGLDVIAIEVQDALELLAEQTGNKITKGAAHKALRVTVNNVLGEMSASDAGEVVRCIGTIEVAGHEDSGASWANYAFGSGGYATGRARIIAYAKSLRGGGGEGMDESEEK